ncbi:bifunctional diaminohydroxyphosphoribosylaminopyrimidine deaminase/5-amino-6-(5-phosphoribosylamino)uracil reductase RibD [Bacillus spongiae]|uniref:Riboflavin biosynthesis protein RibD n=1 Tax=Bacillus spongiae TaxID=2683610 RepID=A0ABU8HHR2_9BACI
MHEYYMKTAISLAMSAKGQTSPNPTVGAIVVKNGRVIGTGVHLQAGHAHAEVFALEQAGEEAENADLYVTLEPCFHTGRTPPCVDLIISKKINRVFIATLDPNPLVAGKSVTKLKEAGIDVRTGILENEARELNQAFFHYIQTDTPFVTLKAAVTLDGKIATATGDSKWITSEKAREDAHQYRHWHDGILVGIGTILNDNPHLTTRLPQSGNHPIRIVLDTHLQIPLSSNIVQVDGCQTIVFCGKNASETKEKDLLRHDVKVVRCKAEKVTIPFVLNELGKRKITSILVEGGAEIHGAFFAQKAFQQLIMYVAPTLIGGQNSLSVFGGQGVKSIDDGLKVEYEKIEKLGSDLKIIAKPLYAEV